MTANRVRAGLAVVLVAVLAASVVLIGHTSSHAAMPDATADLRRGLAPWPPETR